MDHLPMPKFGPLAGLRVVFSGIEIAGPFAGQMFAEWGAEVIWIENVAWADTIRVQPNYPQLSRRNLHALSLNIFKDEGREAFLKLMETTDIFIEASKGPAFARRGITDEVLWQHNPKLVIAHLSGFGQYGTEEYTNLPAYNTIAQAFSGYLIQNGDVDQPMPAFPYTADYFSGLTATTAAGFFVSRRINSWGYRHREEESAYQKKIHYIAQKTESIQLAKDIRIFGLGPWLSDIYESTLRLYDAFINRRERIYTGACAVDALLSLARNGIAYAYLIWLTLTEGLPASQFLLYFSAFTGFSTWVTGILQECSTLHKESLDLSTIQEYLHLPEPFHFADGAPVPPADRYELRLDHVTFRYPGTKKPILQDLCLTIRPGEKVAVVGLNGAGKTTLVKLLCGFYDPDQGRVLLNGQDIRQYDRWDYYALFSSEYQDFSVLEASVAENFGSSYSVSVMPGESYDEGRANDPSTLRYTTDATGYFTLAEGVDALSWHFSGKHTSRGEVEQSGTITGVKTPGRYSLTFRYSPDQPGLIEAVTIRVDDSTDDYDDTIIWSPDPTIEGVGFDLDQTQLYAGGQKQFRITTVKPMTSARLTLNNTPYDLLAAVSSPVAGLQVVKESETALTVTLSDELFAGCSGGDQTLRFEVRDNAGGRAEATCLFALEGLVVPTSSDYDLWHNTLNLRARIFDSSATVTFGVRTEGGSWIEKEGSNSGDGLWSASFGVEYVMYSKFIRAISGRQRKSRNFSAFSLFGAFFGITQESIHILDPSFGTT